MVDLPSCARLGQAVDFYRGTFFRADDLYDLYDLDDVAHVAGGSRLACVVYI